MGGNTSSACPEALDAFAVKASGITRDLEALQGSLLAKYRAFQTSGSVGRVESGPVESVLPAYVQRQKDAVSFVSLVREAFVNADSGELASGVVTVPAAELRAGFVAAATARGLNAAYFDAGPAPLTVPPATTGAIPRDSGFVDDPVCTATGHFLELEDDFVVPPRLAVLAWSRSYSSRLTEEGPFGRGWWTWTQARLVAGAGGDLDYVGPDGRQVSFAPGAAHRVGVAATAGPDGDGWVLHWDVSATWSQQRWRFDGTGRLVEVAGPDVGVTTLTYDAHRLVRLDHEGGRSLALTWKAERVVAARLSDGRQVQYDYDDAGDLVGVRRAAGDRRYDYDGAGRITAVHDADGVRLAANTYDDEGRVTRQVSPFGRETVFEYLEGRLTRVSDTEGGPAALYGHDHLGRLTALIEAEGRRFERSFGPDGRVDAQQHFDGTSLQRTTTAPGDGVAEIAELCASDGSVQRWSYDESGRIVHHERPGGRAVSYGYTGDEAVPCSVRGPHGWGLDLRWDGGLPVEVTDADGVRVTFAHDADGCLVAVTNGVGATTRFEPHIAGRPAVIAYPDGSEARMDWDDAGRLLALVDTAGAVTRFAHTPAGRLSTVVDPLGHRTQIVYGPHGRGEMVIDPLGHAVELRHDQFEQLASVVNPDGGKWEYSYSQLGLPSMVHGPDGSVWSAAHDAEGRLVELVDPLGGTVRRRYDGAGRLVATVDRAGGEHQRAFDDAGRVTGLVDPAGAVTRLAWDALDRLVAVTDADGVAVGRTYTPAGRLASVSVPGAEGPAPSIPGAEGPAPSQGTGAATRYEYDAAGRMTAEVSPSGHRRTYGHDERDRVVTDTAPTGRVVRYEYDDAGRVAAVAVGRGRWTTTYDAAGRVTATTDPLGATTRWSYDPSGRVTAVVDPRGGRVRYRYDETGNLVEMVDPFGRPVVSTYDLMRRPTAVHDQLDRVTTYDHDALGRLTGHMMATGQRFRYDRDARGAVTSVAVDGAEQVRYERDAAGRAVSVREPARGRTQTLGWSAAGRLTAWSNGQDGLAWEHDPAGRLRRRTGMGDDQRFDHDADGRLIGLLSERLGAVRLARDADGRLHGLDAPGLRRWWRHDDHGWLIEYAEQVGSEIPRATRLGRDAAGRIVEVTGPAGDQALYGYDPAGQLVAVVDPGGSRRFDYDAAGRLVADVRGDRRRTYHYDDAHQLTRVETADGAVTLTYDAAGRRVAERHAGGAGRTFAYDPLGRLAGITRHGPSGAVVDDVGVDVDALGHLAGVAGQTLGWDPARRRSVPARIGEYQILSAGGQLVAAVAGADDDQTVTWISTDWRGTVGARDPWGRPSGPDLTDASGTGPRLGFRGEVEIGGLVWLRHRVYDPATAQFLSPDPLPGVPGHPTAAFPYHYAGNDPLRFVDPLGQRPVSIDDYNASRKEATSVNWNAIGKAALIVGGVVLAVAVPGAGLALAITLGAVTGAAMGAGPAIIDGITTGHWDTAAILKGAVVGGIAGAVGGVIPGGGLVSRLALQGLGAASEAVIGEAYDLTGLPGADGSVDVSGIAESTLTGMVPMGRGRPHTLDADPPRVVDPNAGGRGAGGVTGAGAGGGGRHRAPGRADGEEVLSGHGYIATGDATTATVPPGTTVNFYVRHGGTLYDADANPVETGVNPMAPIEVAGPGAEVPDYWLDAPDASIHLDGNPTTVAQPMRLSQILEPNQGTVHWASCREEFTP